MNSLTEEQIRERRARITEYLETQFDDFEIIKSILEPGEHPPLWYLGKSIEMLSEADLAVFDENSSEPQAAGTVIKTPDKIAQGDEVANAFFGHHTTRRLTKEERLKMESEPDDLYKETPTFRSWAGISAGYAQAQIPLTPSSWYRRHIRSRVGDYRVTKDSVSLWNFMDDSTPLFTLYAGGIWFGFIGGEIFYRYSNHAVKTQSR